MDGVWMSVVDNHEALRQVGECDSRVYKPAFMAARQLRRRLAQGAALRPHRVLLHELLHSLVGERLQRDLHAHAVDDLARLGRCVVLQWEGAAM